MTRGALRTGAVGWLLALSTGTMACPPPPPPTPKSIATEQKRVDDFKRHARASAVVYGVLEDGIGYDHEGKVQLGKLGKLRIIHVYRGKFQAGQQVEMRAGFSPLTRCPAPMWLPKGSYGIVILDEAADGGPMPHNGFLSGDLVARFLKEGIIQSARSSAH